MLFFYFSNLLQNYFPEGARLSLFGFGGYPHKYFGYEEYTTKNEIVTAIIDPTVEFYGKFNSNYIIFSWRWREQRSCNMILTMIYTSSIFLVQCVFS